VRSLLVLWRALPVRLAGGMSLRFAMRAVERCNIDHKYVDVPLIGFGKT